VARTDSLGRELEDVNGDFQKFVQKELAGVNAGLTKKKLAAISVLTEADWQKKREAQSAAGAAMANEESAMREMD